MTPCMWVLLAAVAIMPLLLLLGFHCGYVYGKLGISAAEAWKKRINPYEESRHA